MRVIYLRSYAVVALERLRVRAAAVTAGPMIDPRARFVYSLAAIMLLTETILARLLGLSFSGTRLGQIYISLLWFMLIALLARRYGFGRIATLFEAGLLPPLLGGLTVAATFISATVSLPFADEALVRMDTALGFDWRRAFDLYRERPWLLDLSTQVYRSFFAQLSLVPVVVILAGQLTRFWTFLTAWSLAGLVTALIFALMPAVGPYLYFGVTQDDIPGFYRDYPWQTAGIIAAIKSGELTDMTQGLGGLVSFPSFHAIAAVLFSWLGWRVRFLGPLLVILNGAMWLSSIVIGYHYLSDLLAGTLVAIGAIVIARRIVAWLETRTANQGAGERAQIVGR